MRGEERRQQRGEERREQSRGEERREGLLSGTEKAK